MRQILRYGTDSTLEVEMSAESLIADLTGPRGKPLDDPAAELAAALASPLDFPPLIQATVPGDRIVLTLAEGLPQAPSVVLGVVQTLLSDTTRPVDITILQPRASADEHQRHPTSRLPESIRGVVKVVNHNSSDSASLAYLAASKSGQPIYLNRLICDADLVVPIGSARLNNALSGELADDGLFPTFSNDETIERFRRFDAHDWQAEEQRRSEEADETAWLLGIQFAVQVVPGPGDSILHVLAGDVGAVRATGQRLCADAWNFTIPRRANLVVAGIEGGLGQQTWANVDRALTAASQAVTDNGTIVLCTALDHQPAPKPQRAVYAGRDDGDDDTLLAPFASGVSSLTLGERLRDVRVFLVSRLEEDVVEDLGFGHVSRSEEITRLCRRHGSCLFLANAQHAAVTALDD